MNAAAPASWFARVPGPGRVLAGLLVPADPGQALRVVPVADTAAAISDALGEVLVDDAVTWQASPGVWVSVYLDEFRSARPANQRLSVLTTRLGVTDRTFHAAAHGDALILGTTPAGIDVAVPPLVFAAVSQCGYPYERPEVSPAGRPAGAR